MGRDDEGGHRSALPKPSQGDRGILVASILSCQLDNGRHGDLTRNESLVRRTMSSSSTGASPINIVVRSWISFYNLIT